MNCLSGEGVAAARKVPSPKTRIPKPQTTEWIRQSIYMVNPDPNLTPNTHTQAVVEASKKLPTFGDMVPS